MNKNKGGRPKEYTPKVVQKINEQFQEYIDETDIPIISEFAYKNNVRRQTLYEKEEFADSLKKCQEKKEAQLEKLGLFNVVNPTMAIFSLKQMGWRDKPKDDEDDERHEIYKKIAERLLNGNK